MTLAAALIALADTEPDPRRENRLRTAACAALEIEAHLFEYWRERTREQLGLIEFRWWEPEPPAHNFGAVPTTGTEA